MPSSSLIDAMTAAGLGPSKAFDLVEDGKLHRYRVLGDKPGSVNGWYCHHGSAGAFGSWKTNESHTWHQVRATPQTPEERAALQRQMQAMREARAQEQEAVHAQARSKAAKLWARAHPAHGGHPYLVRKQAHAIGVRQLRDMLLIPARDVQGTLHTLQFISPDGTKRFLSGGRIAGCYFAIGTPKEMMLLCEGLATGSTLHMATRQAVAVCFSCGNLQPVARALRSKFPKLKFILCADNDSATPGNPGVTAAQAAARAVGGYLAVPQFKPGLQICPF